MVKIQNWVSDAITVPQKELFGILAEEKQPIVGDSPTRANKRMAWLRVAAAPKFAVFGIFANIKRESPVELMGNYPRDCPELRPRKDVS